MRDLITLIWRGRGIAETTGISIINHEVAREAVAGQRRLYQATLIPRLRGILRKVKATQQRTDDPDCDTLLRGNFIISYLNEDIWFVVHSILREEDLARDGSSG